MYSLTLYRIKQNILQNYLCGDSETMSKSIKSLSTMSEGSNADNTSVAERCVVNDKLTRIETMEIEELKKELKKRRLKITGEKKVLQDRLKAFIALEIEHGEDEEEKEDEERGMFEIAVGGESENEHVSAFRDVLESMNTFSGDDMVDVQIWLFEFEQMCDLHNWTDTQRLIYAKELLRGSAKSFIEHEEYCTSWKKMKKMLSMQFKEKMDVYKVHKELLNRIKNKDVCTKEEYTPLNIVPNERGYFNVGRTEEPPRREYWFRNLHQTVERVVPSLSERAAERKRRNQELLNATENREFLFDTYHVDYFGPLPPSRQNYEYVFIVFDDFSKYVWLYPTRSVNITEIIVHLKRQSSNFGNPRVIISNAETASVANTFHNYCTAEHIQHIWSSGGIRWANDQIIRIKRLLILLLRRLSAQTPSEWHKHLETAQKYLNAIPSSSTNISPFQTVFGTEMRMQGDSQIWQMIVEEQSNLFREERSHVQLETRIRLSRIQALGRWRS